MTVRSWPRDRALELLLEAGHEPAGAELDHLVAPLAAGERHAVERAREVHHDEVAALGLALDGLELGRALAQAGRPPRPTASSETSASRLPTSRPL